MKNRFLSMAAAVVLAASMITGCAGSASETTAAASESETEAAETEAASEESSEATDTDKTVVRIGAMSGPTAMGLVKLMDEAEAGETENEYEFADLATDASAMVTPLAQGDLDIAAVPANLAAALYSKTNGGVEVLAVNALGVLDLVERGETLTGMQDLAGHKIYATGQSAVPEYVIRYILTANGIDPDNDVEIQWCADTAEALAHIKEEEGAIAVLPQPFATAAMAQVDDLRIVEDLNDAWDALDTGSEITTGVLAVRKEFAEEHPEAVEQFLLEYAESAAFAETEPAECASLIENYGIVASAAIAEKALPGCHIVCLTGAGMKDALSGFLQVLYDQNPESVGGSMPGDDFYYGAENNLE